MNYRRKRGRIRPNRSLVQIENVKTRGDARYYLGHTVLYFYRALKIKDPRTGKGVLRLIPGKITNTHGNKGVVRVRFKPNLPSFAFGRGCRVMMWPHRAPN